MNFTEFLSENKMGNDVRSSIVSKYAKTYSFTSKEASDLLFGEPSDELLKKAEAKGYNTDSEYDKHFMKAFTDIEFLIMQGIAADDPEMVKLGKTKL